MDVIEVLEAAKIIIGEALPYSLNMVILTNSSVIQKSIVDPQSSPWKSKLETKILHNATLSGNIHFSSLFDEVAPDRIKRISCGGVIC